MSCRGVEGGLGRRNVVNLPPGALRYDVVEDGRAGFAGAGTLTVRFGKGAVV